jgi:hypothetical protein
MLVAAPLARADGDPASDYLLGQPAFIPPDDGIPKAYATQLTDLLASLKARGYTIRVAVIGTRYDMGSVTIDFRKPKSYARFLGTELSFVYKGRLLVVMPNGLATSTDGKATPTDQKVVDAIPPPGTDGAKLTGAATLAVSRLAANAGVVVPIPPLGHVGGSSGTRDRVTIAVVAIALLLMFFAAEYVRRTRWARSG